MRAANEYVAVPAVTVHQPGRASSGAGAISRSWAYSPIAFATRCRCARSISAGVRCAVLSPDASSQSARVQTESIAVLPGSATSRSSTNPASTFFFRIAALRASGSTTTRCTPGSAKQCSITAPNTWVVNPAAGTPSGGATSTCIPRSPGRSSGRSASGEYAGS